MFPNILISLYLYKDYTYNMRGRNMKKRLSFILSFLLFATLLAPTFTEARTVTAEISSDIVITVNGEKVPFKAAIISGESYLPVRVIGYALNSTVDWNDDTRNIMLETEDERVPYKEFSDLVSINSGKIAAKPVTNMDLYLNEKHYQDVSKQIVVIENRSYLPIRNVAEKLGIRSTWNDETRTIEVINPRTVQVEKIDKPYYVKDLPVIKTGEDYLVGNWKGKDAMWIGSRDNNYITDSVLYISRNSNGNYDVVERTTINEPHKPKHNGRGYVGKYANTSFTSTSDSTGLLHLKTSNFQQLESDFGKLTTNDNDFNLDGEKIYINYPNGQKARYTRF